uniref:Uncharacterized protein MANES_02G179400 n=1 Tax=Rhizophora mucronata TaxID=61149 RepID=A0A2P2MFM1_RHIMU
MLSASMEITYSVVVVLRVRFADRRNFPFSTSKAAKPQHQLEPQHQHIEGKQQRENTKEDL